jgi:hypothetical protein
VENAWPAVRCSVAAITASNAGTGIAAFVAHISEFSGQVRLTPAALSPQARKKRNNRKGRAKHHFSASSGIFA